MANPPGKKKPVRKFNFDPASISPKAHLVKDNIVEHINNERKLRSESNLLSNNYNGKYFKHEINQLINNHQYPKTNEEMELRIQYIDKQIRLKLKSKQIIDEYICKFENIFLKENLKDYHKIVEKTSEWEETELKNYDKLNKEYEEYILNLINEYNRNRQDTQQRINDRPVNIDFENFKVDVIGKSLETKAKEEVAQTELKTEEAAA